MRPATPTRPTGGNDTHVAQRFEQWFKAHSLDLPPETRAQFVDMGIDAVQRWPDRSRDEVLDELIAELDGRLTRIVDETAAGRDATSPTRPEAARPSGAFARLFGRRSRRN